MAPHPGEGQHQQQQRLTQANLQQHAQANPSVPHPAGGRQPPSAGGAVDDKPGTDADPAGCPPDSEPAAIAEDSRDAAAPLERALSAAVERAVEEGASVSTGLPLNASTYSDDTLAHPPAGAARATPPPRSSRNERGRDTAEAAAAAVAAVDADRPHGGGPAGGAEDKSLPADSGGQTAAERAADCGVSVSTGLSDDASIGTDTTFQPGASPGRRSFDSSLGVISEVGPAEQAAREGRSISTGLGREASVASDTTANYSQGEFGRPAR